MGGGIEEVDELSKLKQQIQTLINLALSSKDARDRRIIIIIDDLDRINPGEAFKLTEALKVYLDVKGCVFILCCDEEIIRQGMAMELGINEEKEKIARGRDYIDKIIQSSYTLPLLNEKQCSDLLERSYFFDQVKGLCGKDENELEKLFGQFKEIVMLSPAIKSNPRNIKKLMLNYQLALSITGLFNKMYDVKDPSVFLDERYKQLLMLNCIYMTSRRYYENLRTAIVKGGQPDVVGIFGDEIELGEKLWQYFIDSGWKIETLSDLFT